MTALGPGVQIPDRPEDFERVRAMLADPAQRAKLLADPEVKAELRRDPVLRYLRRLLAGRDPASDHDKARADKSLSVVLDQFMAEHVRPKLKASTATGVQLQKDPSF